MRANRAEYTPLGSYVNIIIMLSKKTSIEIVGWYGAVAILVAYILVSLQIIQPQELIYQLLNLSGAAGIALVSLAKRARQPAILNIVWSAIALVAVINILIS